MTGYSGQPVIRPATEEDVDRFKGEQSLGPSVSAIVGEVDGELIALGGLAYQNGKVVAFLDLKPGAERFKKSLHKAALMVMEMAKERGHRFVYAQASPDEPGAERWLRRLGFAPQNGNGQYRWPK